MTDARSGSEPSERTRLPRVWVADPSEGERRIGDAEARYLTRVLRLGAGDRFTAFDPEREIEAEAVIARVARDHLVCRLATPVAAARHGSRGVTLIQCAAKGDKIDDVVRAATALGVGRLIVAESERSVVRLSREPGRRNERWHAIALDAARQSGRGDLPQIDGPSLLAELVPTLAADPALKLCLDPLGETGLGALVAGRGERGVVLLVGPEGGLSAREIEAAERSGFVRARLGGLVLRTELASVAALGAVLAAT